LTNLLYFLYLVSRTLLLKLQYCRVNANNTNKQEQEIKNKENSKREKKIEKILLSYSIKRISFLRKQLDIEAILDLCECNAKAISQATTNRCFRS